VQLGLPAGLPRTCASPCSSSSSVASATTSQGHAPAAPGPNSRRWAWQALREPVRGRGALPDGRWRVDELAPDAWSASRIRISPTSSPSSPASSSPARLMSLSCLLKCLASHGKKAPLYCCIISCLMSFLLAGLLLCKTVATIMCHA
jgi:hypothetical protein